jgi:hypothetical protein
LVSDRRCHKGHEDLCLGRPTWPFAWLAEESSATQYAELEAMSEAVQARDLHPELLAQELVERLHGQGRIRIRRTLQRASRDLREAVGNHPALAELARELRRLEQSYV